MTANDLIEFFGTQTAAARALGCAPSSFNEWLTIGYVPDGRQYQAQIATKGKLKADKPALRTSSIGNPNAVSNKKTALPT